MLKFDVQNQTIKRTDTFRAVADSKNYLKAEFTMTEEWQGGAAAVFGYGGSFYRVLLDDKNSCTVPWEVIKPPLFTVSLFCGGESLVTANVATVAVEVSGMKDGAEPTEPTPEIWQQYMSKMQQSIENMVPFIGENGNWYFYNTESGEYEDSGVLVAPEKGVDYWTDEDKAEIKEEVEPFVVNVTVAEDGTITADKTYDEIEEAYENGTAVLAYVKHTGVVTTGGREKDILTLIECGNSYARFSSIGAQDEDTSLATFLSVQTQTLVDMSGNITYKNICSIETVLLPSKDYVDGQIGDIETALDNIITKYGLGGDTV